MELLIIVGVALLLGWAAISVMPRALAYIPASLQSNKWVTVLATGLFLVIAFFVIAWVARHTVDGKVEARL